jgi:hypothetical protein
MASCNAWIIWIDTDVCPGFITDLSKKIEDVINATVKQKPDEPISFMVRQLQSRSSQDVCARCPSPACLGAGQIVLP